MKRLTWCVLVAACLSMLWSVAAAQAGLRDAVDGLVREYGGDVDGVIETVSGLAQRAPGQLEALRENQEAVAAFRQAARLAGVPQVAVDALLDPEAAFDTVAAHAGDLQVLLDALHEAATGPAVPSNDTLAQAPPSEEPQQPAPQAEAAPPPTEAAPEDAPAPTPPGEGEPAPLDPQPAPALPPGVTEVRSPLADALGFATWLELALVIVSWLTLTWLFFFLLWRVLMPANPFLAVRLAYSLSVLAALAYLTFVFWPKFFEVVVPDEVSYLHYVVAGVIAVIVMIVLWASYRTQTDADEGA